MKLTDRQIRTSKAPTSGRLTLTDGCGLQLRITSSNKRSWSLQYRHQGRMLKYTIGSYPDVSLKDARTRSQELRCAVQAGQNPQADKIAARRADKLSVCDCFEEYLITHLKVHLKSWPEYERAMRKDVLPHIGSVALTDLDKAQIRLVISKIIGRGATTLANRVLQYISKMLKWAVGVGYLDANPASDIPKPAKEQSRERSLTLDEIRAIHIAARQMGGPQGRLIEFLLLSGQRLNEVARLTWDEVKEDRLEIPGLRNKSGETLITPLLPSLLEILDECPRGDGSFVFTTGNGTRPISGFSQIKASLSKSSGVTDWNFHDFRRSLATLLSDKGMDRFSIKCALNHKDGSVTGIYDRSEHFKRKSMVLTQWQNMIEGVQTHSVQLLQHALA